MEQVQKIFQIMDNREMKEVKGLGGRLSRLEHLMFGARILVQEQSDMAQVAFTTVYCTFYQCHNNLELYGEHI